MQIAKLCGVRGSIANNTAKNLDSEQTKKLCDLMNQVWADPEIQSAKYQLCTILASTIKNEYKDMSVALEEAWIAVWLGAVDTLFHRPKKQIAKELYQKYGIPKSNLLIKNLKECIAKYKEVTGKEPELPNEIEVNRKSRIKFFKTYIYNRMMQILRENKLNKTTIKTQKIGKPKDIALQEIENIIKNDKINYTIDNNTIIIDMYFMSDKAINRINKIRKKFKEFLEIVIKNDKMTIKSNYDYEIAIELPKSIVVQDNSIDANKDDDKENTNSLRNELRIPKNRSDNLQIKESIEHLKKRLCFYPKALKMLEIIIIEGEYNKNNVAATLGTTSEETDDLHKIIKSQCRSIGLV